MACQIVIDAVYYENIGRISDYMFDSKDSFVHFEHVQKSYDGEALVVKDLNLDIPHGEFLTMLGPSGSGKTTTLMMLAGFEPVTHGEIYLNGESIHNVPPAKRGIGMVFQNYALFPHMSVAENLSFPLKVRKMGRSEIEDRVNKVLEMVELPQMGNRRPAQLSGGQQQRVAVARALVFDPKLILMDEPLGALDKQLREQMQYEIKHIHENLGVTVVYVTHDQSEALTMSNRIAVFDDGIIQQLSTPDALYERPENSFVAQFIGENNTLRGQITDTNGNLCKVKLPSGDVITALMAHDSLGQGSDTLLSLRPERVICDPRGEESDKHASIPSENILEGEICELIYLGDHIRTRMSIVGNDEFIVKIPNHANFRPLVEGEKIQIGWRAEDCRALDAPTGS